MPQSHKQHLAREVLKHISRLVLACLGLFCYTIASTGGFPIH